MVMDRFRKHMTIMFWIISIAFVGGFGLSSLWDSFTQRGRSSQISSGDFPPDTAFVVKSMIIPEIFFQIEIGRELSLSQQRGTYISPKERDIIEEGVFFNKILDEEVFSKAENIGFGLSNNYLNLLLDTLTYYDRFFAQERHLSPDYFEKFVYKREMTKALKTLIGMSAWLSPYQAMTYMHLQSDKFQAEYIYIPLQSELEFEVNDSMLVDLYDTLRLLGLTWRPEQVFVDYISLPYGPQEEDWIRIERNITNLKNNIINSGEDSLGRSFASIAEEVSDDIGSKANGGYLGWLTRGVSIDARFIEVVFNTPVGEIGGPVRTEYGWHIIYVNDNEIDSVEIYHILLKVTGDTERDQKTIDLMETVIKEARTTGLSHVADKYSLQIRRSLPFDRWGEYVPEFGFIQSLVNFAFSADSGVVKGSYYGNENIVVIQTVGHLPAREVRFDDIRRELEDSLKIEYEFGQSFVKALNGVDFIAQGMSLEDVANRISGEFVDSIEFSFYSNIPYSSSGGIVQSVAFTAPDTGYYGPIKGFHGTYLVHLMSRETQPDSIIQNDMPYFWFHLSMSRSSEFINQWSLSILNKAFSTGDIFDLRYKENEN